MGLNEKVHAHLASGRRANLHQRRGPAGGSQGDAGIAQRCRLPAGKSGDAVRAGGDAAAPAVFHRAVDADRAEPGTRQTRAVQAAAHRRADDLQERRHHRRPQDLRRAGGGRPLPRNAEDHPSPVPDGKRGHGQRSGHQTYRSSLKRRRIMQVDSAAAASNVAATPSTKPASSSIDYNTFLQLMIAEMKFQDPTNPTDTSQYMSQFAQFSSVEQGIKTNTKLDSLLSSQALSQADNLIGHTATSPDGSVTGKIASLTVSSTGGTTATLSDGRTLSLGDGVTI